MITSLGSNIDQGFNFSYFSLLMLCGGLDWATSKYQDRKYKQNTSLESHKTQFKFHPNPGLP